MSSKAANKRASLKNKEIYDPITQMFSYITENRTVEVWIWTIWHSDKFL